MSKSSAKRVFISYSHDSNPHKKWVLQLASRLRSEGVDAWIDRYVAAPSEGWPRWMQGQIEEADYIIIICTENYRRRFEGREKNGIGKGVTWEGLLANQIIYDDSSRNLAFIPVIPSGGTDNNIPIVLRPFTSYLLDDEYNALYRHITGQPEIVPDPLGEIVSLISKAGSRSSNQGKKEENERVLEQRSIESDGFPNYPFVGSSALVTSPDADNCFSKELLSLYNGDVFHSGVVSTKYGAESSTWTIRVMDEHKLFDEKGEIGELNPFLVIVESSTKEAISIVANTKLWIKNPIASGSTVRAGDRIGTLLIPKSNEMYPPFTISRGTAYEGILKYRPRINDRFWRAFDSSNKYNQLEIIKHRSDKDSGVTYLSAPSAGLFEPSSEFHYKPGSAIVPNECLGYIHRGGLRYGIHSAYGGILLSTMIRNNEAVHIGQRLFRVRTGSPVLYMTMMPLQTETSFWYEVLSPVNGKFSFEEDTSRGKIITSGTKFENGDPLCKIDTGDISIKLGVDLDGSVMQIFPAQNDEVKFGQLLMLVRADRLIIRSPIVGNFYRSPSPDADPFVMEGQKVRKGQTLCIIEALKLENEIESDVEGVVKEIFVENGHRAEWADPLFIIERQE